jgi:pimeloyl-ACP methyl ester carboxylesterase
LTQSAAETAALPVSLSHHWPVEDGGAQSAFSWRTHVAELAEFIVNMNVGPVHLVGHSRGGCVAFHLANQYPSLVKTLTLADPAGPLQIDGTPEAAYRWRRLRFARKSLI